MFICCLQISITFVTLGINVLERSEVSRKMSERMQEYVLNIGLEKSPSLLFQNQNTETGRRIRTGVHFSAGGKLNHTLIQHFFKLYLSEVQGTQQDARSLDECLQMAGRHCRGPAGSSSCPTPTGAPGLSFHPRDSPLLPPLAEPSSGKDFLALYLVSCFKLFHRKERPTSNSARLIPG